MNLAAGTNRVDGVIASLLRGNMLTQWHGLVTQSNLASLVIIDVTNQPAPVATRVQVSWPVPATLLCSTNLTDWPAQTLSGTTTVTLPLKDREFFRVPVPGQSVSLSWDASVSPEVAGYNLYQGSASFVYTNETDVGTNLSWTVPIPAGATWYWIVTAYDGSGVESVPSNEVSYSAPVFGPAKISLQ
jgi:hypothetical protein